LTFRVNQSLAKTSASVNYPSAPPPRLTQIDAPFSSRLSRDTIARKTTKPTSRKRSAPPSSRPAARPDTKHARVIAMLRKPAGVTIAAIMTATDWQQHSVRGFLAGVVRKKLGLNLVSEQTDKGRVYRIKDGNAAPASAVRAQQAG
jgi:Protein of unknown function (DUF3489)